MSNFICAETVDAFTNNGVPSEVFAMANVEAEHHYETDSQYQQHTFTENAISWRELDFRSCRYIVETMFRIGCGFDIIAILLNGAFGDIMGKIAISAALRSSTYAKKQNETDRCAEQRIGHKTRSQVRKNLFDELEEIKAIANSIVFDGNEKTVLVVPSEFVGETERGSTRNDGVVSLWRKMVCFRRYSGETVKIAAMFSAHECAMMKKVMNHNAGCSANSAQYMIFNTVMPDETTEDSLSDSLLTGRLNKIFARRPIAGCIRTAYRVAADKFIGMMFGDSGKIHKFISEHRAEKFSISLPEMPPILLEEWVVANATTTQRQIFEASLDPRNARASDVFRAITLGKANPMSQATFYREWEAIIKIAKAIAD